jgi:hypothetical protein
MIAVIHGEQEDAKRLPSAIFSCTVKQASAAQLLRSTASPPAESSTDALDAPSLLDTSGTDGVVSTGTAAEGGASVTSEQGVYSIGGQAQQFSFANRVSSALDDGSSVAETANP